MPDARPLRRKRLLLAAAFVAAALALDTLVWTLACRRLDDGIHDAASQAGLTIDAAASRWSGWPIAAALTLTDAMLRNGAHLAPPFEWKVSSLVVRQSAVDPLHLVITAAGRQSLALGARPAVPFTASRSAATIDLKQRAPARLDIEALTIDTPAPLRIATTALRLTPDGWSADLAGLSLPGPDGRPIHPSIDTLTLVGRITPPIDMLPAATTVSETARTWRAHDGHLDLVLQNLHWGALAASAHAIATLDPALQPRADGTLTATGLPATLTQLADTGLITAPTAAAARGVLTILAAPAGDGPVTLPFTWDDGVLAIARFPLLRTAPLDWN